MAKNSEENSGGVRDGDLKESAGRFNKDAGKAFKAASYAAAALNGDIKGLAKRAVLDTVQSEAFLGTAEKGLKKVTEIPAVPPSLTRNFSKAAKGILGAVPALSVAMKILSAKEIAEKIGGEFRKGEYVRGGVVLCSELSQTLLGTAAGSVVSEGIGFVATKIDPRYAPEKSGGRQTIESLAEGCGQVYDAIRDRVSAPAPALAKPAPI